MQDQDSPSVTSFLTTSEDLSTSQVLQKIVSSIQSPTITLRELVILMGQNGLLILCALLSLPFLFPVSIPGVSTVFGAGIVLIGVAVVLHRTPWLPGFLADRKIDTQKLRPVLEKGISALQRLDVYFKPRLLFFTQAKANRVNAVALVFSGLLLMMPLGLIPFSNTLPGLAILFFAVGISQRDGLLVALGYILILITLIFFSSIAYLVYFAGQSIF